SFVTFRIRILRRIKTAGGISHLTQDVIENAFDSLSRERRLAYLKIVKIKPREQGIVVKHLFEMRDEPFGVGRVAMKTTAELIVNSALRHFLTCVTNNLECITIASTNVCAQQEFQRHRRWKLWRTAETA